MPKAVASRLSLYLRELQHLIEQGEETTSSSQLGSKLGFTDAQVRKDLAYFGHFGYPGIGYRCDKLVAAIKKILGTDQQWNAVLVGAEPGAGPIGLQRVRPAGIPRRRGIRHRFPQGRVTDRRRGGIAPGRPARVRQGESRPGWELSRCQRRKRRL